MTECQKKQQMRKIRSYQMSIKEALKLMAEQRKRAEYFQGLVNQIREAMKEDGTKEEEK
jgi:hypothetical protein